MKINSGSSALTDAHPIKPFHDVLRKHEFYPVQSQRSDNGSRINYYSKTSEPGKRNIELGKTPSVMIAYNKKQGPTSLARNPAKGRSSPNLLGSTPEELNSNIKKLI